MTITEGIVEAKEKEILFHIIFVQSIFFFGEKTLGQIIQAFFTFNNNGIWSWDLIMKQACYQQITTNFTGNLFFF